MTKLDICAIENANPGVVWLYPEGSFYKAYQQSTWLLHPSRYRISKGTFVKL